MSRLNLFDWWVIRTGGCCPSAIPLSLFGPSPARDADALARQSRTSLADAVLQTLLAFAKHEARHMPASSHGPPAAAPLTRDPEVARQSKLCAAFPVPAQRVAQHVACIVSYILYHIYCIIYRRCVQGGGGDPVAAVRREIEAQMRAKMQRDHSDAAMQRAREEAEAQARCARPLFLVCFLVQAK